MANGSRQIDLRQAVKKLEALPAMPVIAQKILALKLDTDEGDRMLLVLIEQDSQISAKILGLANSSQTEASHQIMTVLDATILLGIKRVQMIATSIATMSMMTKTHPKKFNMHDLWSHSFVIAFGMVGLARIMPATTRPQEDQAFLAGMLHDIGYQALAFIDPKLSDKLHNRLTADPNRPMLEVEREILDICHDELGAELARHWNLPKGIIDVLRYHHNPDAAEAEIGQPLVRMLNIVEKLLPSFGILDYVTPVISNEEWKALGIDPSTAEVVKKQIDEEAEQAIQFVSSLA